MMDAGMLIDVDHYTTSPSGVVIPDTCRHSTRTFAQMYQYAADVMGAEVALGSDFNGIAGHIGPRFGPDACGGEVSEWVPEYRSGSRLPYPFDLTAVGEPGFGSFDRQVTGGKTFDFNVDGLAHIGLLPDMGADLARVGLPQSYLDQLFGSAEQFIRVWEQASGVSPDANAVTAACQAVTVEADDAYRAPASIATAAEQADPRLTLSQSPPGPYGLGTTPVTLTVGATTSCQTDTCAAGVTVVDRTGPTMSCAPAVRTECVGGTTPVAHGGASASDNCGTTTDEGCSPPSGARLPLGDATVTCSARDCAGNAAS